MEQQGIVQKTEDFEDDTLQFDFVGDWVRVTTSPHSGSSCFRNKDIGDSQTSQTQITVTLVQDGSVSFWYRVSSEANYDKLWFYIDGVEKLGGKSGNIGWTQVTYLLTAGTHTLIWKYTKDGSVSSGEDSAYIDDLVINGLGGTTYAYVPEGSAIYHIQTENLTQITGNKLFLNIEQPGNTNIEFYISEDNINWQFISNNTSIDWLINSQKRDFYIKVLLQTLDNSISPIVNSINFSAWYEVQSFLKREKEFIRLYDLHGNLVAILENAYDIVVEEKLNDAETLEFSIPFNDSKSQYIKHDEEVIYANKRYIISQIVDGRDDSGKEIVNVSCELAYIELLNSTKQGEFLIDRKSAIDGLKQLLTGTRWTVGTIEADSDGIYSLKEVDKTVLWLVRQWAKIVGLEIQWDSINRKINMLQQIGSNRGAGFRYKKNLKSIKRTVKPPEATVLYAYGKNGLSIADFNDGKEYLEDYSWYTSQGLTLTEAKAKFRKEYIWQDDRFILTQNLLDAAKKKLAELSQPIISYECNVLDLSSITGLSEDKFFIGDTVRVYDSELKIDVMTRILRLKRYPQEPWKNEVELSYIIPGLQDTEEQSISSDIAAAQPSMLFATNNQQLTITTTQQYPVSLSITNFSSTNAQIGLMIVGQASAALVLTVKFFLAGTQIGPTIQQQCQAGYNTIGVPFVLAQIQQGSAMLGVQMYTSTGTFTIAAQHLQFYVYATNLLGGVGSEAPRVNWEENIDVKVLQLNMVASAETQLPITIGNEEVIKLEQIATSAIVTLS
nr:phage tail spike protein [Thermoanaerobacterium sp. R66]